VKTEKRALAGNTPANGNLDCDKFQRAMLTYRNTPDPVTKISPAIAVFARPIKELILVLPGKLYLYTHWDKLLDARETTMAARGATEVAKWSQHTRALPPLWIGDQVRIQNQTGPAPRRRDKTGTVTEVKQFDQYWIKLSGSGHASSLTLLRPRLTRSQRPFCHLSHLPIRVHLPWNQTRIPPHGTHFQGNSLRHRDRSHWKCSLVNRQNLPPPQTDLSHLPCGVQPGNV